MWCSLQQGVAISPLSRIIDFSFFFFELPADHQNKQLVHALIAHKGMLLKYEQWQWNINYNCSLVPRSLDTACSCFPGRPCWPIDPLSQVRALRNVGYNCQSVGNNVEGIVCVLVCVLYRSTPPRARKGLTPRPVDWIPRVYPAAAFIQ